MDKNKSKSLFDSIKIGSIECKNRMIMAPLTRQRGTQDGLLTQCVLDYYAQRAGFGLIITEASGISKRGNSYPGSLEIYEKKHMESWKKIVDAVHQKGGKIMIQLTHVGRVSHKDITGQDPWAPSAIAISGKVPQSQTAGKTINFPVPKEMTQADIKEAIAQFKNAAQLAKQAGFDGVEIHGGNGYLVDQFIRDGTNQRKDNYGGSIENRCRFALEVVDAVISVVGADRTAIRITPNGRYNDMYDSDPIKTYTYLINELNKKKLGFLEIKEAAETDKSTDPKKLPGKQQWPDVCKTLRPIFKGVLSDNESYNKDSALAKIQSGDADVICFGRLSMTNPDLVERFKNNWELNQNIDWSKAFCGNEKGYSDYPFYQESKK